MTLSVVQVIQQWVVLAVMLFIMVWSVVAIGLGLGLVVAKDRVFASAKCSI